ncbi:MAG: hypothetical protein JO189_20775 [Deltaproteobacteria bacterium]|nr:hypothetical protein [Deltaproteobacteria bacterium]
MNRISFLLTIYLLWLCCQLPIHAARATTSCAYSFSSGSGNTFLNYCVTVNGNIPLIKTPSGVQLMGPDGEGYGVCNESPAQNYTDYGISDTGNWRPAILLSHNTSGSVQIARTTSDGQWTLTQTIALTHTPSITVIMALKNNQSVQKVAYLVRFADPLPPGVADYTYVGGLNGALTWDAPQYGLLLQNVGAPPFGFWQGYVQTVTTGPNACAFAFNEANLNEVVGVPPGSIEVAYVGPVPAGGTKTVTLTYRGL